MPNTKIPRKHPVSQKCYTVKLHTDADVLWASGNEGGPDQSHLSHKLNEGLALNAVIVGQGA